MNHAKKMVLISPDVLRRLNTTSKDNTLDTIENDMNKILHTPELEDRAKWSQYQQLMQRCQFFQDQLRQPTEIPIIEKPTVSDSTQKFEVEILRTLPKAYKTKGELLFRRLCDNEVITWDKNGSVSINGTVIVGSNIVDLVCDVIRYKKSGSPVGWKEFTSALSEINVPQEFIGNHQRRQQPPPSPRPVFPTLNARRRRTITPINSRNRRSRNWSHLH